MEEEKAKTDQWQPLSSLLSVILIQSCHMTTFSGNTFTDQIQVFSIQSDPIRLLWVRSVPIKNLSVRSDPIQILSTALFYYHIMFGLFC